MRMIAIDWWSANPNLDLSKLTYSNELIQGCETEKPKPDKSDHAKRKK